MSGTPGKSPDVIQARREMGDPGEPLNTEDRRVQVYGDAKYINLTGVGCSVLGLEKGDDVKVKTYPDKIEIELPEGGDGH